MEATHPFSVSSVCLLVALLVLAVALAAARMWNSLGCLVMTTPTLVQPPTRVEHVESVFDASSVPQLPALRQAVFALADQRAREHAVKPGPTFAGTIVPRRVMVVHHSATRADLLPSLEAAVSTWEADAEAPEIAYYSLQGARTFIFEHFPEAVGAAYDALRPYAYKADVFRLCELLVFGGVYVDVKASRLVPIARLVGAGGLVVWDIGDKVWNGLFAVAPGAAWIAHALCLAVERVAQRSYGASPFDIAGPEVVGRGLRAALGLSATDSSCAFLQDAARPEALQPEALQLEALQPNAPRPKAHEARALEAQGYRVLRLHVTSAPVVRELEARDAGEDLVTTDNPAYRAAQAEERGGTAPETQYWVAYAKKLVYV
jgi:hypothetical protein